MGIKDKLMSKPLDIFVDFEKINKETNKLKRWFMNAHKAAYKILTEIGHSLTSKEIAQIALTKGYVESDAKDPISSIAATIEKNIRGGTYNSPRLLKYGRKIGLPSMEETNQMEKASRTDQNPEGRKRITIELPQKLIDDIQLANQAKLAGNYDDTVALLLQKGLSALKHEIQKRVNNQLENI